MREVVEILLTNGWTPGATGIWVLVLMGIAYAIREWRETRKLSAEDRQARREGYARQVEALMAENHALSDDLRLLRKEYDNYRKLCHEETDQLRTQVVELQNLVTGFERKLASQQTANSRAERRQK